MTTFTQNRPTVGNLIIDDVGGVGIISLVDSVTALYYVLWASGSLQGYTTAHKTREIERWSKNVRPNT